LLYDSTGSTQRCPTTGGTAPTEGDLWARIRASKREIEMSKRRPRRLLVNACAAFALLTTTAYAQEATIQAQLDCPLGPFTNNCPVPAGLIPGGGPARSDCYVELNVVGIESPGPDVRGGRVVSCTDGDPCDTDGECGNGSCTFSVAVCINQ